MLCLSCKVTAWMMASYDVKRPLVEDHAILSERSSAGAIPKSRRGYLYFEDEPGRRTAAICLWMTQGWFRMSPAVPAGRCEQRLTSGLPKPITAPCGSLTQLASR